MRQETDLAEGTELELIAVDQDFDPAERALVLEAIDEGLDDIERGDHVDGFAFVEQLESERCSFGSVSSRSNRR